MTPKAISRATAAFIATFILLSAAGPAVADFNNGLLRALAPDIIGFIGMTLLLIAMAWGARKAISAVAATDAEIGVAAVKHGDVLKAHRNVNTGVRWLWYVIVAAFLWHAFAVTWSLRIPRSDVNSTDVYQQMDRLTR